MTVECERPAGAQGGVEGEGGEGGDGVAPTVPERKILQNTKL